VPDLTVRAFDEAKRLDHGWVGPEHFLLALLSESSVATEVLSNLGVTYDRLADHLRSHRGDPDVPDPRYDPEQGLCGPNPAGHQLMGRSAGLAAAWGFTTPEPEHWLLAMIYSEHAVASLLDYLGVSQTSLLNELHHRGIRVPDVDPPAYKPWRGHHEIRIDASELQAVLDLLTERHPPGSEWRWGFNWLPAEPGRARVDSEEGIDLEAILTEVRRKRRRPPSP